MKDNIDTSKRKFLKKAAYSAPVIVGLGSLTLASDAHASGCGPMSSKNCGRWGGGHKLGNGSMGHDRPGHKPRRNLTDLQRYSFS